MSNLIRIVIPTILAISALAAIGGCTAKSPNQAVEGTWQGRAERLKSKCTSPRQKQRLFRIEGGGAHARFCYTPYTFLGVFFV